MKALSFGEGWERFTKKGIHLVDACMLNGYIIIK